MKTLFASALSLLVLNASPVMAQEGGGAPSARSLAQHQALVRGLERERAALLRSPNAVFDGRQYIGADPDPAVRNDLMHSDNRGD